MFSNADGRASEVLMTGITQNNLSAFAGPPILSAIRNLQTTTGGEL
ncbi:hypothetical protein [Hoeflea sp.]